MTATLAAVARRIYDPSRLTFEPETHTYRVDGEAWPSVTQILDRLHSFAGVPEDVLEAARERGTYVHQLTELHDLDDLDEPLVPPEYQGYLAAWKKFLHEAQPNWSGIEEMAYSPAYRFAGTMDRHGELEALRFRGRWVIDIKSSLSAHPVWGPQVAAYRQMKAEQDPSFALYRRGTVQLRPDGSYLFTEWKDPADWQIFLALRILIERTRQWPR